MPYSSRYSARTVSRGSLPGLRARTKPAPSSSASAAPSRKPRASAAIDDVDVQRPGVVGQRADGALQRLGRGHHRRDVLEDDPGLREVGDVAHVPREIHGPRVAHGPTILRRSRIEQQVLEVRRDGGEVLQRLDGLLAPLGVARAQRRGEDLLQQRGLAVGRRAERAQVAPADAVARQLGDRADDLALGLVVVGLPARSSPLMTPYSSSSATRRGSARVSSTTSSSVYSAPPPVTDTLGRRRAAGAGRRDVGRRGHGRLVAVDAARGQLLADDPQRQELVALHAQDRAQPRDVAGRVEPVAAGRAPRLEQLLVLEVADLRDRDVRELLAQRLAHRADRHRLRRRSLVGRRDQGLLVGRFLHGGHQRERNVSLYLPTCSSSPSARWWDSIRRRLT